MALPLTSGFRNDSKPKPEKINDRNSMAFYNMGFWEYSYRTRCNERICFKNKKKTSVTIKSVEHGCSCTVSDFTPGEIKKNKEGKIIATYHLIEDHINAVVADSDI